MASCQKFDEFLCWPQLQPTSSKRNLNLNSRHQKTPSSTKYSRHLLKAGIGISLSLTEDHSLHLTTVQRSPVSSNVKAEKVDAQHYDVKAEIASNLLGSRQPLQREVRDRRRLSLQCECQDQQPWQMPDQHLRQRCQIYCTIRDTSTADAPFSFSLACLKSAVEPQIFAS